MISVLAFLPLVPSYPYSLTSFPLSTLPITIKSLLLPLHPTTKYLSSTTLPYHYNLPLTTLPPPPLNLTSISLSLTVVIESLREIPPLDLDSVLFIGPERRALGQIFDVYGPCSHPMYVIRFNSAEHAAESGAVPGEEVFFAPSSEDHTHYVILEELMRFVCVWVCLCVGVWVWVCGCGCVLIIDIHFSFLYISPYLPMSSSSSYHPLPLPFRYRGSDASGLQDNELGPGEILDFSDDEEEARVRRLNRPRPAGPRVSCCIALPCFTLLYLALSCFILLYLALPCFTLLYLALPCFILPLPCFTLPLSCSVLLHTSLLCLRDATIGLSVRECETVRESCVQRD